jgi:hypothetical protein
VVGVPAFAAAEPVIGGDVGGVLTAACHSSG